MAFKDQESSEMCATMVAVEDLPAEEERIDCADEELELLSIADFEFIGKLLVAD